MARVCRAPAATRERAGHAGKCWAGGAPQLALAALWLLDAVPQFQNFMFSEGFPRMVAATAAGNPGPVADPVTWSAHLIGAHPGTTTAVSGIVQLLLALGIVWRPGDPACCRARTRRAALCLVVLTARGHVGRWQDLGASEAPVRNAVAGAAITFSVVEGKTTASGSSGCDAVSGVTSGRDCDCQQLGCSDLFGNWLTVSS